MTCAVVCEWHDYVMFVAQNVTTVTLQRSLSCADFDVKVLDYFYWSLRHEMFTQWKGQVTF